MITLNRYFKNIVKHIKSKSSYNVKINFVVFIHIAYALYFLTGSQNRYEFKNKYPILNKIYEKIIRTIGEKISIEVKQCKRCGILFIPDYRVQKQQHNCPYGCVLDNRKEIVRRAKQNNRKKFSTRMQNSKNNRRYRERIKNGLSPKHILVKSSKPYPCKLENQILYIYRQLFPSGNKEDMKKMSFLLKKVAVRCKNERYPIFTNLKKYIYSLKKRQKVTVERRE